MKNKIISRAFQIDDRIIIKPMNELKKKHRDRIGIIVELEDHLLPSWADVKFEDTKRVCKVDTCDLELMPE